MSESSSFVTGSPRRDSLTAWACPSGSVTIQLQRETNKSPSHRRNADGDGVCLCSSRVR